MVTIMTDSLHESCRHIRVIAHDKNGKISSRDRQRASAAVTIEGSLGLSYSTLIPIRDLRSKPFTIATPREAPL